MSTEITPEILQAVAEWCWPDAECNLRYQWFQRADGNRYALEWLLTPNGREAMEKEVLAKGLTLFYELQPHTCYVRIVSGHGPNDTVAFSERPMPAESLALAIYLLAKGGQK